MQQKVAQECRLGRALRFGIPTAKYVCERAYGGTASIAAGEPLGNFGTPGRFLSFHVANLGNAGELRRVVKCFWSRRRYAMVKSAPSKVAEPLPGVRTVPPRLIPTGMRGHGVW
jgi:hypothetical protein